MWHLLERQTRCARVVLQDQPVVTVDVRFANGRRLVAWAVPQTQWPPVALRKQPSICAVQHYLPQQRHALTRCVHRGIVAGNAHLIRTSYSFGIDQVLRRSIRVCSMSAIRAMPALSLAISSRISA